jgi:hypothetical protein
VGTWALSGNTISVPNVTRFPRCDVFVIISRRLSATGTARQHAGLQAKQVLCTSLLYKSTSYYFRSVVGVATDYGLDNWGVGVLVQVGPRIVSKSYRPALGSTQPPIQWVPGALSPGVKRPGREADHSPPASAEAKKMWIYTSTPPCTFMAL